MTLWSRLLVSSAILFGSAYRLFSWGIPGTPRNLLDGPWPGLDILVSPGVSGASVPPGWEPGGVVWFR